MANSTKEVKTRLTSISGAKKITKAMEMIAASRMRRTVERTKAARDYEISAWKLGVLLSGQVKLDPISSLRKLVFANPNNKSSILLVITGNRGLCGSFNANVVSLAMRFLEREGHENVEVVCLGKKGAELLQARGVAVSRFFQKDDNPKNSECIMSVADYLFYKMREGRAGRTWVTGSSFVSSFEQRPILKPLFPLAFDEVAKETIAEITGESEEAPELEAGKKRWYRFEPNASLILERLVLAIGESRIYQALLESAAGEQAARMLAMQAATKAAGEMYDEQLVVFNKLRQGMITQELAEISAARAAMVN